MVRKSTHPNKQLFDFLNGVLDERASQPVEQHLSGCADCRALAEIVRALKSQVSNPELKSSGDHPDVSELAAFFYGKSEGARDKGATQRVGMTDVIRSSLQKTAAHVAMCRSCAEELSLYAKAEHASAHYDPARDRIRAETPRAAREMIENWEDTIYARPKPEIAPLNEEMMQKLARLLEERKAQLSDLERRAVARSSVEAGNLVPVIVVSESGEFRSMELFESAASPAGFCLLKHPEESGRFDNKPFYALLDFGEEKPAVMSYLIRHGTVRLERVARPSAILPRATYFIVED